jgi:pimeloyl-ACP methyl ester carboxylesterase
VPVAERRCDVAGVDTVILEGGEGPPLVLLHGIGSFAPEWALVISELVRDHRVVAPDLPGLGASTIGPGKRTVGDAVAWLDDLIAQTCDAAPTIVGHSLGGALAAHYAIEHGDRIRRIVLVDASSLGRFRPAPGVVFALMRYGARPSPRSRDRFLRQVLVDVDRARATWGDRWAGLEAYDIEQASTTSVDRATRDLLLGIGIRRIDPDRLADIGVPVSLIWGRRDRLMRLRIAQRASKRYGWPLHVLEDCGHGPQIECPAAFVEALAAAALP